MQIQNSYSKLNSMMTHVLIWAAFALFFYRQLFFADGYIPPEYWVKQTVTFALLIVAFYCNSQLFVPRLLLKNHTALYIVVIIVIVVLIALINRWVDNAFSPYYNTNGGFGAPDMPRTRQRRAPGHPLKIQTGFRFRLGDLFTVIITGLMLGISTSITALQKWQKDVRDRKEHEKDKILTELSLLKAQINPHFFFNTLNNIYALTEINPKLAGEAIHRLSKMMRYLLYETIEGKNMLSHEIDFVRNYISLMKLRLTGLAEISISVPERLQDMPLPPMIFLPFVENAFKHGVSATQPSFVNITISQNEKLLFLTVKNSLLKDNSISLDSDNGIGLVNTRRRLDLLYPGKYNLDINSPSSTRGYTVNLVIDLS